MFSHLDADNQPTMVDVGGKPVTRRSAQARARILLPEVVRAGLAGGELHTPKGPVFQTAIIAGTMAAKRTHELIPLCHPLMLTKVEVEVSPAPALPGLHVTARAKVTGQTGVEMEALTAVSVACLTIYDMAKAADRGMRIEGIRLLEKSGGRSGHFRATDAA